MSEEQAVAVRAPERSTRRKRIALESDRGPSLELPSERPRHPVFQASWRTLNLLLVLWLLVAIYSVTWEYSIRMYLKGFSDAVVPSLASPDEQVEAILNWMSRGPTRRDAGPLNPTVDRDPADTLNYQSLLRVCGSATNAFINLADSGGLVVRRLLLLDPHRLTRHVVAEVLIDGRWIVVDPAFRVILRDSTGRLLTREQLNQPSTFIDATSKIPNYDSSYTYESTVHVRLAHLPVIGSLLRRATDRFFPSWEGWPTVSLLLERESLAAVFVAITLVFFVSILRVLLRLFGERHLEIRTVHFRQQVTRAFRAFLATSS